MHIKHTMNSVPCITLETELFDHSCTSLVILYTMDYIFPIANGLEGWTHDLDRNIINYLTHTGSLACVCKKCEEVCLARNAGRLCCPTQQFYHPNDAKLLSREEFEDIDTDVIETSQVQHRIILAKDEEDDDYHGLSACEFEDKVVRTQWRWTCCGENFCFTGCKAVNDVDDDEDTDTNMAIRSNEEARAQAFERNREDEDDGYAQCDWDDSINGDAMRGCNCGYADDLNTYCSCGIGYRKTIDDYIDDHNNEDVSIEDYNNEDESIEDYDTDHKELNRGNESSGDYSIDHSLFD
jgi:hypothetical protein